MASSESNPTGLAERLALLLTRLRQQWQGLGGARQRSVLLGVLATIAIASAALWWSTRTDWRVLLRGLEGRDMVQASQELSTAGVPFRSTPDGSALEVPAEQMDKARVAIASKGMPGSGRFGFELFDKPNWIGSEFDERVNYQRALEGELEHTIGTLDAVQTARVHIVLPRQGAFSAEDVPAKASVVLKLRRGDLPQAQASSIRSLLAGAVEGLHPDAVTLVDADGRSDLTMASGHAAEREEEVALEQKLIRVLEPLAGPGNVRATVGISYREGTEERTDEIYDPAQSVPLTTQRSEQSSQSVRNGGIPGTASNTPAAVPVAAAGVTGATPATQQAAGAAAAPGQSQTTREESSTFAVTRHLVHTQDGPGRVRRISAAILINDRLTSDGAGKQTHTAWKSRSPEEMSRLTQLAQAAVGFEQARGDQLVMQNVGFSENADPIARPAYERAAVTARGLLRDQGSLLRNLTTGLVILVLGFAVLRPLSRQTSNLLAAPAVPAAVHLLEAEGENNTASALPQIGSNQASRVLFERVREQIRREPLGSTRLLESWLQTPAEEMDV